MNIDDELKEIFNDPLLNLSDKELSLFEIPTDMKQAQDKREQAEYVAKRKVCEDFDKYKGLFETVHNELKTGRRSLVKLSKTENINPGSFFIVSGQMVFLDSMDEKYLNVNNRRYDARTRCIYETGFESDILLQTLRKGVMDDGYAITKTQEEVEQSMFSNDELSDKDQVTGYIYVLSSLSNQPEIANQTDLYKIGFTINSVEERIANAINDPTYLMAPVNIEASYKIVNLNSHVFETLLHKVLDSVQMQITIKDKAGTIYHPKEWYLVPFPVIETIIRKILDGSITKYIYNPQMKCLEKTILKTESTFDTTGMKILSLNVKKASFDAIINGEQTKEKREIKQSSIKKYTYVDEADGKRYLKRFNVIHFFVGNNKNSENAIVEVKDTTFDKGIVEYKLGNILEHIKNED